MEHKNLKKRILLAMTTVLLLANLVAIPIAGAAGCKIDKCTYLNPDSKDGQPIIKTMVVTISEEEIGGDTADIGEMCVKYCFRKTSCKPDANNKTTCNSEYADGCTPNAQDSCQRVQVLSAQTGSALLYGYIGLIYRYAATTIGIVSVLYLVYGGILITTAGDNSGQIDKAKEKIFQSIAGLVLLFLSGVILYTINPNFFTLT